MPTSPPTPHTGPPADPHHEPRRTDCPWCGGRRLRTRARATPPRRRGPGTCAVEQCRDCGHAFQNPRLTAEGLALRHLAFYASHLGDFAGRTLSPGAVRRRYLAVAHTVLALTEPESWLDVGTGHARFPETAREVFPYTSFDGLDPTPRVEQARRAGRVEEAHIGDLTNPRVLPRLRSRYDVVSVFHHLEHSPDPRAELRAALTALRPGGLLLLELPDPRSLFGTLLGRRWLPYGQPRHLHLLPLANLCAELEAQGCTILATDRRTPHIPYDLSAALSLSLAQAPPFLRRVLGPLVATASALDHMLAPLLRRTRFSNAYRVIARRGQPRSTSA
ncbi:methyltransferase type 12 [Streptomyces sp. MUSC 14]|uniref:methyltransferase domain-containing protein n=1 Tax=Streptomyces sp. MUSC 14 TaxID=1354889 RepID=UPI0008F56B14|nr:methyltransferase domain-containing protein [Streptomyces sp. MUSC 14]OIJ98076.1 methyltransferase type 12 [Streptomyces sp. MUSC 14]